MFITHFAGSIASVPLVPLAVSAYGTGQTFGGAFVLWVIVKITLKILRVTSRGEPVFTKGSKFPLIVVALLALLGVVFYFAWQSGPGAKKKAETAAAAPDMELTRLQAEAQTKYTELQQQRTTLDAHNDAAVKAFNANVASYQRLLTEIARRSKAPAAKPAQ